MEIRETLFKKSFSVENSDTYGLALDFMRKLSDTYRIYEKKNIFETDGPVRKSILIFDVIESLDRFSHIMINFSMESENNNLYVDIVGEFVVDIREQGFFTGIFTEFYLNNIFPKLRKVSECRINELNAELERI